MTRHTDSLAELLGTTDAAFAPPLLQSDLARAVRRRAIVAAAFALRNRNPVVCLLGIAVLLHRRPRVIYPGGHSAPPSRATNPRESESQLRELRATADTQHATLERWRRSHDTRAGWSVFTRLAAAAPSPGVIAVERERAALILLDHADRLRLELKEEEAARRLPTDDRAVPRHPLGRSRPATDGTDADLISRQRKRNYEAFSLHARAPGRCHRKQFGGSGTRRSPNLRAPSSHSSAPSASTGTPVHSRPTSVRFSTFCSAGTSRGSSARKPSACRRTW